jgi:hypothetical protein
MKFVENVKNPHIFYFGYSRTHLDEPCMVQDLVFETFGNLLVQGSWQDHFILAKNSLILGEIMGISFRVVYLSLANQTMYNNLPLKEEKERGC